MKRYNLNSKLIFIILSIVISLTKCSKRYPLEEKNDPLLQLFVINFANEYYSNSCKHPSFIFKRGESRPMELKLNEMKWFRFSAEGTTPHSYSNNPVSNHPFLLKRFPKLKLRGSQVTLV